MVGFECLQRQLSLAEVQHKNRSALPVAEAGQSGEYISSAVYVQSQLNPKEYKLRILNPPNRFLGEPMNRFQILFLAVFLALSIQSASAATYYVSNTNPSCSNTGTGSLAQPFCDIATANARHIGGDTVYLMPGEYREAISPKQGTSGQYTKFIGYGTRDQIRLQGSDVVSGPWTSEGNGIYSASFTGPSGQYINLGGYGCYPEDVNCFEDADRPLIPVGTLAQVTAPGMNYYDPVSSKMYVRSSTLTPADHKIACNVRLNYLGYGNSYLSIQNLTMLHSCRDGIIMGEGDHDIEIKNNEIAYTSSSCANNGGGIFKGHDHDPSNIYNPNFQIIGNRVHDTGCWFGSGYSYATGGFGIEFYDFGDSLVADNEVFNSGNGIYLKSFSNNVTVRNNKVHDSDNGIMLLASASNDIIEGNSIYNTYSRVGDAGGGVGIYAIQTQNNIIMRGNTILNASVGIALGDYSRLPVGSGFTFRNNIIKNIPSRSGMEGAYYEGNYFVLWSDSAPTTNSNYNLFHNSPQHIATTTTSLKTGVVAYDTLAQWQATGDDLNSKVADPQFISTDPANPNFLRLSSTSPAIDAGEIIPGYHCARADNDPANPYPASDPSCRHWCGSAPDIGALEYCGAYVDTTPPVISNPQPPLGAILPLGTTQTTLSVSTNENANCRYSTTSAQAFNSMTPFATTGGTAHSQTIPGLANGGSYNYYIKCRDLAATPNTNPTDYQISFTVASTCTESWTCGTWGTCTNNVQSRTCTDANNCGTVVNRPPLTQACTSTCTESWSCGAWGTCTAGSQTRTCTDANNCGTTTTRPALSQSCTGTANECDNWQTNHPDWLWCEDFESGSLSRFDSTSGQIAITTDPNGVYQGRYASETALITGGAQGGNFRKYFAGQDTVYLRWYAKFEQGWVGDGPHFLHLRGALPTNLNSCDIGYAGCKPPGTDCITGSSVDPRPDGNNYPAPGAFMFYSYSMDMVCDYGGYCSGAYADNIHNQCVAIGWRNATDRKECCWGNLYMQDAPAVPFTPNTWQAVEMMIKINSIVGGVAQADGEMMLWIDGVLKRHVYNMRWRTNPDLKINYLGTTNYVGTVTHNQKIWVDNVVASRSYIGPLNGTQSSCTESWSCGAWSTCTAGSQTRTCTDANSCGTTINRPALSQSCTSNCTPTILVDSTYAGYSTSVIDDGIINANGGTSTTWASGQDNTVAHWVEKDYCSPTAINNATIWWAFNSGQNSYMTSQTVQVQYFNGAAWQTAATIPYPGANQPISTVSFAPISAARWRLYQPAAQGALTYSSVMWLTEMSLTYSPTADVVPPAAISDLTASSPTAFNITVRWTAPGDDGTVGTASQYDIRYSTSAITAANFGSAYQVLSPPAPLVSGTQQSMVVGGLNPATAYYFAVKTADKVPNWSTISNIVSSTTLAAPDTTPPQRSNGQPSGMLQAGIASINMNLSTNENANCKYSGISGQSFSAMPNAFAITGSQIHSVLLNGLQNGQSYNYFVKCNDTSGNANPDDYIISFGVAVPPDLPPSAFLNAPNSGYSTFSSAVSLNCSATDDNGLNKLDLYSNVSGSWQLMQSRPVSGKATTQIYDLTGISPGSYIWNCIANDSAGQTRFGVTNYTFTVLRKITSFTITPATDSFSASNDPNTVTNRLFSVSNTGNQNLSGLTCAVNATWAAVSNCTSTLLVNAPSSPLITFNTSNIPTGIYSVILSISATNATTQISSIVVNVSSRPFNPIPQISNIANSTTYSSASITWNTDVNSNSTVNYGINPASLTSSVSAPENVQQHSLTIPGLTPSTVYYYEVISCSLGGCSKSSAFSFTTVALPSGCAYNNPPCANGFSCQNNICIQNYVPPSVSNGPANSNTGTSSNVIPQGTPKSSVKTSPTPTLAPKEFSQTIIDIEQQLPDISFDQTAQKDVQDMLQQAKELERQGNRERALVLLNQARKKLNDTVAKSKEKKADFTWQIVILLLILLSAGAIYYMKKKLQPIKNS